MGSAALQADSLPTELSVQFSHCPTLCDPMNRSMQGLPAHHQLLEFTQTHVHCVGDAIQPYHPLSWESPCRNTGVGCHFQGIFLT